MAEPLFIVQAIWILLMTCTHCNAQEVGTELHVTLGVGTSATLPCAYENKVFAVYWKKSEIGASEAENYVVVLDARSTPGTRMYHMDGFNITDDFSLTIADVNFQDEGRYFCIVSDYATGTLVTGYTDVTVEKRMVLGETPVTLQAGGGATIPCQFDEMATDMRWRKDGIMIFDNDRYQISTEDHSLFVRHVTIWDGGNYVCEYFDPDTKSVYQKEKHVTVIGKPVSPFPTVDACKHKTREVTQNCTVKSSAALILTCSVKYYFPNISLVFLLDEELVALQTSKETTNSDGTKNKLISIRAAPNDKPYVCTAYDIPGIDGERAALIMIKEPHGKSYTTAVTVVSVIMMGALVGIAIGWYIRRKHSNRKGKGTDEESQLLPLQSDSLSYIAILELVCYAERTGALDKLVGALQASKIIKSGESTTYTVTQLYIALCDPKAGDRETSRKELLDVFRKVSDESTDFVQYLKGFNDQQQMVPDDLAEHVFYEIGVRKVEKVLNELGVSLDSAAECTQPKVARDYLRKFREWKRDSPGNLLVKLCRALEKAQCKPIHKTFFLVKEKWIKSISTDEVQRLASHLKQRHRTRISNILSKSETKGESKSTDDKGRPEEEDIFNTRKMIQDWILLQTGSNYQIRCKLWEAATTAGRYDILGCILTLHDEPEYAGLSYESTLEILHSFGHPVPRLPNNVNYDQNIMQTLDIYQKNYIHMDEFQQVVKYLKREDKLQLLSKLGVQPPEKMTDEKVVATLCQWRDDTLSSSDVTSLNLFHDIGKELQYQGCIPELKGEHVSDAELAGIEFAMVLEDILPFSEALGLDTGGLNKYRTTPTVLPEVRKLLEQPRKGTMKSRSTLCGSLVKAGFLDIARMTGLNHEQSLSEMYGITSNLDDKQMVSIMEKVGLTMEDIGSCKNSPGNIKLSEVIGKWRRKKHPSSYYFWEELAKAIESVNRLQNFAKKIFADIENDVKAMLTLVENLNDKKMRKLASKLGLSETEHDAFRNILTPNDKSGLLKLWRNKLHPASYNYKKMFGDALVSVMDTETVSVGNMSDAEESSKELLARLPELNQVEITIIGIKLGLTQDEMDVVHFGQDAKLEMLKLWKSKLHPPLYHYRLELADALELINMPELARDALSGKFNPEKPAIIVIADICSRITEDDRERISDIMKISPKALSELELAMKIAEFSMKKGLLFGIKHLMDNAEAKDEEMVLMRRKMQDKLFQEGFSELAQELSLLTT